MIERKILIGLITQTEYLRQLQADWNAEYIESATARMVAQWCWEYFDKFHKAPDRDIENIFIEKLRKNLKKEIGEEIGNDILPSLSEEYEKDGINNIQYLIEQTKDYFKERQLIIHNETIAQLLSKNKINEALKLAQEFKLKTSEKDENELDLSNEIVLSKIDSAFDTTYQNVISFPGALGEFWNDQLVRGGLIGVLAPEKRGKTFWLLEFMMRAFSQNRKVAFFQAGDMTENQMLIRICVYLAKKSNKEKHCGIKYIPVQDCIKNQTDNCEKRIRECNFGVFAMSEDEVRKNITLKELKEAYEEYPDYKPCFNCVEWTKNKYGAVWLKKENIKSPLTVREAKRKVKRFFINSKLSVKLSTHVNTTLTISKIKEILNKWKTEEEFTPDIILIDYGDLIVPETRGEFRHQQNEIWKQFRGLSQEGNCLVIVPTQSDTDSYKRDRLGMDNFNEDKRKFGHVTAMYGLNQDVAGREKEIGLMRLNKIVVREDDFHVTHEVTVLQKLEIGRPFLGSYF